MLDHLEKDWEYCVEQGAEFSYEEYKELLPTLEPRLHMPVNGYDWITHVLWDDGFSGAVLGIYDEDGLLTVVRHDSENDSAYVIWARNTGFQNLKE